MRSFLEHQPRFFFFFWKRSQSGLDQFDYQYLLFALISYNLWFIFSVFKSLSPHDSLTPSFLLFLSLSIYLLLSQLSLSFPRSLISSHSELPDWRQTNPGSVNRGFQNRQVRSGPMVVDCPPGRNPECCTEWTALLSAICAQPGRRAMREQKNKSK